MLRDRWLAQGERGLTLALLLIGSLLRSLGYAGLSVTLAVSTQYGWLGVHVSTSHRAEAALGLMTQGESTITTLRRWCYRWH